MTLWTAGVLVSRKMSSKHRAQLASLLNPHQDSFCRPRCFHTNAEEQTRVQPVPQKLHQMRQWAQAVPG